MRKLEDLTHNEEYKTKLKITIGNYDCQDSYIVVPVDDWTVQITPADVKKLFHVNFSDCEPMTQFFLQHISKNGTSMESLQSYAAENGILGKDFDHDTVFFRLYHSCAPRSIERDDVGRKWIDFNKQLKSHPGYIEDENGYGLWATFGNTKDLRKLLTGTILYGDSIAILQLFPTERYRIHEGKHELNGNRYLVEFHGLLNNPTTWIYLQKYFDINALVEYDPNATKWGRIVKTITN